MRGHCLCGTIRYEFDPPALSCVTCHCDSCRRQCAAPMTTYFGAFIRDLDGNKLEAVTFPAP